VVLKTLSLFNWCLSSRDKVSEGMGKRKWRCDTVTSLGAFEGSRREILGEYVFRRRLEMRCRDARACDGS
jgi:hypothetical protein